MSNSEQWLKLALKVATSYRDETRSNWTSATDRNVMIRCINTLLSGKALSGAQQDAFVRSIRMRVGGQYAERAFPVDVFLTRDQLVRAKANYAGILTKLATAYEYDFERVINLRSTCDKVATEIQPTCDLLATNLRPTCDKVATNLLPTCDKRSENNNVLISLGSLTERNETKRNETARQVPDDLSSVRSSLGLAPREPLASPSDEVALTPPKQSGSPAGSPVAFSQSASDGQEVLSHLTFIEKMSAIGAKPNAGSAQRVGNTNLAGSRDYGDMSLEELQQISAMAQEFNRSRGYVPEAPKEFIGDVAEGIRVRGKAKIECSLWDNNAKLTGEVVIGNEIYYVNFETYHSFEERLFNRHIDSLMDKHWLSRYMWHEVGSQYRKQMSSFTHQDGVGIKLAMSALYSDRDCTLVTANRAAIRAYWTGQTLTAIELYNGTDVQTQKIRVNEKRGARSPAYKQQ